MLRMHKKKCTSISTDRSCHHLCDLLSTHRSNNDRGHHESMKMLHYMCRWYSLLSSWKAETCVSDCVRTQQHHGSMAGTMTGATSHWALQEVFHAIHLHTVPLPCRLLFRWLSRATVTLSAMQVCDIYTIRTPSGLTASPTMFCWTTAVGYNHLPPCTLVYIELRCMS